MDFILPAGAATCDVFGPIWWGVTRIVTWWKCHGLAQHFDGGILRTNQPMEKVPGNGETTRSRTTTYRTLTQRAPKQTCKSILPSTCRGCSDSGLSFGSVHRMRRCYGCGASFLLPRLRLTLASRRHCMMGIAKDTATYKTWQWWVGFAPISTSDAIVERKGKSWPPITNCKVSGVERFCCSRCATGEIKPWLRILLTGAMRRLLLDSFS